jgi:heme A synthase
METIATIHGVLSNTTWLFFLLLGIWGLFRAIRKHGITGSYWGALVIGEGLYIAQAVLGIVLWVGGERPGRTVHLLYGIFALVALPGLFAYLKGDDSNRSQWYFGLLTLFLCGVAWRAIGTGV